MAAKILLSALALAGTVLAQCGTGNSLTIESQSDAVGIQACPTYTGDIIISANLSGTISLAGLRRIDGDLVCEGAENLNSISADQLNEITGTWNLNGLITLSTLQFDSIERVNRINWVNLPNLQALNFQRGISEANTVYISNTQLRDLKGIELSQVGSMDVNNNPQLNTINVNDLTNVTDALSLSANGRNLNVMFPNLEGAGNITFRNLASVTMPSLAEVPGAIGFYTDTFQNISAPNLTRIGRSLAVVGCSQVTALDFPQLELINGGFLLANNTNLKEVVGLPSLARVGGAIDMAGSFESVSFPALSDVRGGANVQTSSTNTSICDFFNNARSRDIVQGNVRCITGTNDPQNNSTSGGGGNNQNAASALAHGSLAGAATAAFGLVAALLLL